MAYVKDQWTRSVNQADGTTARVRTAKWGLRKRWLAGWGESGRAGVVEGAGTKTAAERHGLGWRRIGRVGNTSIPLPGRLGSGRVPTGG